ncbi:MAG: 30S ribosomal protein S27e [Nanoarchaeota archaeon]|nr:30S ribosomal protein S27e [Nanoarchaeota archaeon]MBU1104055.1 30S ribosomal protein S27e [Nanoarchaeota archaeon]
MEMKQCMTSRFVRVVCPRCGNKQIVFGKSSMKVKCVSCNRLLVKTRGGKIRIRAWVREVLQ